MPGPISAKTYLSIELLTHVVTYHIQKLYKATFMNDDHQTKEFVVWIDESEVYKYVPYSL